MASSSNLNAVVPSSQTTKRKAPTTALSNEPHSKKPLTTSQPKASGTVSSDSKEMKESKAISQAPINSDALDSKRAPISAKTKKKKSITSSEDDEDAMENVLVDTEGQKRFVSPNDGKLVNELLNFIEALCIQRIIGNAWDNDFLDELSKALREKLELHHLDFAKKLQALYTKEYAKDKCVQEFHEDLIQLCRLPIRDFGKDSQIIGSMSLSDEDDCSSDDDTSLSDTSSSSSSSGSSSSEEDSEDEKSSAAAKPISNRQKFATTARDLILRNPLSITTEEVKKKNNLISPGLNKKEEALLYFGGQSPMLQHIAWIAFIVYGNMGRNKKKGNAMESQISPKMKISILKSLIGMHGSGVVTEELPDQLAKLNAVLKGLPDDEQALIKKQYAALCQYYADCASNYPYAKEQFPQIKVQIMRDLGLHEELKGTKRLAQFEAVMDKGDPKFQRACEDWYKKPKDIKDSTGEVIAIQLERIGFLEMRDTLDMASAYTKVKKVRNKDLEAKKFTFPHVRSIPAQSLSKAKNATLERAKHYCKEKKLDFKAEMFVYTGGQTKLIHLVTWVTKLIRTKAANTRGKLSLEVGNKLKAEMRRSAPEYSEFISGYYAHHAKRIIKNLQENKESATEKKPTIGKRVDTSSIYEIPIDLLVKHKIDLLGDLAGTNRLLMALFNLNAKQAILSCDEWFNFSVRDNCICIAYKPLDEMREKLDIHDAQTRKSRLEGGLQGKKRMTAPLVSEEEMQKRAEQHKKELIIVREAIAKYQAEHPELGSDSNEAASSSPASSTRPRPAASSSRAASSSTPRPSSTATTSSARASSSTASSTRRPSSTATTSLARASSSTASSTRRPSSTATTSLARASSSTASSTRRPSSTAAASSSMTSSTRRPSSTAAASSSTTSSTRRPSSTAAASSTRASSSTGSVNASTVPVTKKPGFHIPKKNEAKVDAGLALATTDANALSVQSASVPSHNASGASLISSSSPLRSNSLFTLSTAPAPTSAAAPVVARAAVQSAVLTPLVDDEHNRHKK